jgi:hypothetical protein
MRGKMKKKLKIILLYDNNELQSSLPLVEDIVDNCTDWTETGVGDT